MSKVIASQYEGVCPNCPDGIYPDEAILKGPHGWEHALCANPYSGTAEEMTSPLCTNCYIHHGAHIECA